MSKVVLYAKQSDKIRKWECFADGAEVVVIHGQVGGKQTEKRYTAEAKNQGRSNATTPESQALLEVEAKVVKQLKSGYFYTEEEAMSFEPFEPLKAQPFTDFAHKVKYPCVVQAKFNGQRLMIDKNGNAWSKQGEPLSLPAHWKGIRELAIQTQGLDGEIYAGLESEGGLSLQDIISAFRKPNANTPKLQYWVYDVPLKGVTFRERFDKLHELVGAVFDKDISYIQVVPGIVVDTAEQADSLFEYNVGEGYEGLMYRNLDGLYEFGKRSYDLIKRKTFIDFEAKVLSVAKDKNDCGVLLCEAVNGKGVGTQFKVLMRKDADAVNYRLYDNAITLIGKHIVVEGDEFSDDNIVTKPRGIALREVINGEGRF